MEARHPMKSLVFKSFEQDYSIRPAPSASALITEYHKVVDYSSGTGYIYSKLYHVDHIETGCTADDVASTAAVPGSAPAVNIAGRTWDSDLLCWKIPVLRTAGGSSTGDTYVTLRGRLSESDVG
jgi:hypothetical protein